jgi:stage II sporulation protein D
MNAATVRVRLDQKTVEMDYEQYVTAILAGESSTFQSLEALKAMAVAARTYSAYQRGRHSAEGYDFCDTTHCQHLDLEAITSKMQNAARATAGELLWFDGKPALTTYSKDCGGKTEVWTDRSLPYLKSHNDEYCVRGGPSSWRWETSGTQLFEALRIAGLKAPARIETIEITRTTASGRAAELALRGGDLSVRIAASSLRFAAGRQYGFSTIRSEQFRVTGSGGRFLFEGRGAGHGVGLCQRGAEQMGVAAKTYQDILAYYYPGAVLGLNAKGIRWTKINGERISLLSTQPQQEGMVLASAEKQLQAAVAATGFPAPTGIDIRVYPDVETFRHATGEPGWVSARASGLRIEIQPAALLRSKGILDSTLRHELLHVVIESQSKPGLPVWFREGLVGVLSESGSHSGAGPGDVRERNDEGQARRAYADVHRRVSALINRYGRATVLGWVRSGLPREVISATSNRPPVKSK